MNWRDSECFPESKGGWGIKHGSKFKPISEQEAKVHAKKVSSFLGAGGPLISSPATSRFLSLIRVPELQAHILSLVASKLKALALIALILGLICGVLSAVQTFDGGASLTPIAVLMLLISAFYFYHYRVASRDQSTYLEWSMYLDWQKRNMGINYYASLGTICIFGLLQLGYGIAGHERDFLFYKIGVVFNLIDQGEYWRFFIGPFLHSSISHWFLNFLLCMFVLLHLSPFKNRLNVLLFGYLAVILSAVIEYGQYKLTVSDAQETAGFAGVSALVFYALGFALTNVLRNKEWYPAHHVNCLAASTIIILISPHVVVNNISFLAHIFGLLFGMIAGLFFKP